MHTNNLLCIMHNDLLLKQCQFIVVCHLATRTSYFNAYDTILICLYDIEFKILRSQVETEFNKIK